MEKIKKVTINVKVNKEVKDEATKILNDLGLNMYFAQIIIHGKIPFKISANDLPNYEKKNK